MSYDIYLIDTKTNKTFEFNEKHQFGGGTHALGGTDQAWLNITYNYSKFYHETIDEEKGIRWLYGKTAKECLPILEKAVEKLGTKQTLNYWDATPGNAGHALLGLIAFCKACPDGVFEGD